jgi:RNA polymerase sigma-70 factor, ECF subfamily
MPLVHDLPAQSRGLCTTPDADRSAEAGYADLVSRMADGDQDAAATLHGACYPWLLRISRSIVREYADAEEVVNDAFGKAWRDSANFDEARGTVSGWLTMIVRSRARDLVRARARRALACDRAEQDAAHDPTAVNMGWSTAWDSARAVESKELETALLRVLQQLPNSQREAIDLVFLQSTSHSLAADQLGVPLGTVKTRVRLGLRRMREALDGSELR